MMLAYMIRLHSILSAIFNLIPSINLTHKIGSLIIGSSNLFFDLGIGMKETYASYLIVTSVYSINYFGIKGYVVVSL